MFNSHRIDPRKSVLCLAGIVLWFLLISSTNVTEAGEATVNGVLFFSPTCGHCHKVMEQDLPPLQDRYGEQLILIFIDVSTEDGSTLFGKAIEHFQVPPERRGVPMLVIGDTVLVGSVEIPNLLPAIIDNGLAVGGVPWPDIPGLEVNQAAETIAERRPGYFEKFSQDPIANTLSVIVLAGMIMSVLWIGEAYFRVIPPAKVTWPAWLIPLLATIGLIIAGYLSYIEITQSEAICGPIGNCNAVQSSPYARLFGLVPIGVIGLVGYLAILILWLFQLSGKQERRKMAISLLWILAFAGTLFSVYLTFLEPFVIGATCIWCISSAVIMTILLWASSGPALIIIREQNSRSKPYRTISRKKV